nr:hypothetical protein [Tanacetum cinerariifolium]
MLNKENYVPWSSRLLSYVKSRPNEKLIYNSIMNGPYVRQMIPEPGDRNRKIPVSGTFHKQTNDELTKKELKQVKTDDQSIQTILLGLPEDIYAAVDSCETAQEIWLRVQQIMKGSDIGIQEKKAKLFNEWEMITSTDGESIESYYHRFLKLMNDFKGNKHFPEKITNNLNETKEKRCCLLQTQLLIAQKEEARIQLQAEKFDLMATAADLDEIEEVNENCILMANLQQASTSGTQTDKAPVYDSEGSAEVHHYDNFYNNDIFNMFTQEELYTELPEPILKPHQVQQNDINVIYEVSSVEQGGGTIDQHPAIVEETCAYFESLYNNLVIEVEKITKFRNTILKEAAKFVRDFKSLAKEADDTLVKHKALELEIERLLRAVVSQNIMSIVQRVDNTAKTRRPQPRNNTKNDRVLSESKSSCIKNKEVEVEEHPRNSLLSKNKKHMSSECNNVKLAIRNDKSEVVCAMYIGKLGAKGDIGFFIGYSADSCANRVYNQRTKKITETINVTFDELSAMAFE